MDAEKAEKVINGLEHCADRSQCNNECPYSDIIQDQNEGMDSCITQLSKDALSVIRELKAENERLKSDISFAVKTIKDREKTYREAEENCRLHSDTDECVYTRADLFDASASAYNTALELLKTPI